MLRRTSSTFPGRRKRIRKTERTSLTKRTSLIKRTTLTKRTSPTKRTTLTKRTSPTKRTRVTKELSQRKRVTKTTRGSTRRKRKGMREVNQAPHPPAPHHPAVMRSDASRETGLLCSLMILSVQHDDCVWMSVH